MRLEILERQIENDLDWREAELAIFRELLSHKETKTLRARALSRAAWSLLYAHYEGFSKFCLDLYLDFLAKRFTDCNTLPDRLFVFFIEKEIQKARSLPTDRIFDFFTKDIRSLRQSPPKPTEIDTRSNLWPDLLANILRQLDLDPETIVTDTRKLRTLVARRNDIAHGRKVFVEDLAIYLEYENATLDVMYGLALAVVERAGRFGRDENSSPQQDLP